MALHFKLQINKVKKWCLFFSLTFLVPPELDYLALLSALRHFIIINRHIPRGINKLINRVTTTLETKEKDSIMVKWCSNVVPEFLEKYLSSPRKPCVLLAGSVLSLKCKKLWFLWNWSIYDIGWSRTPLSAT